MKIRTKIRTLILSTVLVLAVGSTAFADGHVTTLDTASVGEWGTALVNGEGMSLYLYVLDEEAEDGFACVDGCLNTWLPLYAADAESVVASGDVNPEWVGVRERADGQAQVTYGGWPLYTSRRDVEPGQSRGQGLGDQFFLVSTDGAAVTERIGVDAVEVDEATFASLMGDGGPLYARHCASCHAAEGQGLVGPSLDGMGTLDTPNLILNAIIFGRMQHGMPAFGDVLDDSEIAALATYVRNSWSNDYGAVLEEDVADAR